MGRAGVPCRNRIIFSGLEIRLLHDAGGYTSRALFSGGNHGKQEGGVNLKKEYRWYFLKIAAFIRLFIRWYPILNRRPQPTIYYAPCRK